jgi:hypothetical protein
MGMGFARKRASPSDERQLQKTGDEHTPRCRRTFRAPDAPAEAHYAEAQMAMLDSER